MARTQVFLLSLVALLAGSLLCMLSRELHPAQTTVAMQSPPSASPVQIQQPSQIQQPPPGPESPAVTAPPSEAQASSLEPPPTKPPSRPIELTDYSSRLSEYLHDNHLCYVDAQVFGKRDGHPSSVTLLGRVRTPRGQEDAGLRSRDFLGSRRFHIDNRVVIDASVLCPDVASNSPASNPPPAEPFTGPSGSAPANGTSATTAQADPCLCLKDASYCKNTCLNSSTSNLFGIPVPAVSGLGQSAANAKQCVDNCENVKDHCVANCAQSAGPGQPPDAANPPSEGPDQPPG